MRSTRRGFYAATSLALALAVVVPERARAGGDDHRHRRDGRLAGYFINWGIYGRGYFVKNIVTSGSASRLTHVLYAFANVAPRSDLDPTLVCKITDQWSDYERPATAADDLDGVGQSYDSAALLGNFGQLRRLKARFPRLKVLISVGGFTFSANFSEAAKTEESRRALAESCIDLFVEGHLPPKFEGGPAVDGSGVFDGIDIDWEWPGNCIAGCPSSPDDKENFTLLLGELRRQLDALGRESGRRYQLTAFAPAGLFNIDNIEVKKVARLVSFLTLQGYDLHGTWESTTNFQSPLFVCRDDPNPADARLLNDHFVVNTYLKRGAPRDKLVLGVPFYGRGWAGVPDADHGLFQPSTGAAPGEFAEEPGVASYRFLKGLLGTYGLFRDGSCRADWLYSPTDQVFWTYDGKRVMRTKAEYVDHRNLGGVMFWELTGDDPEGSLVKVLHRGLR